MKMQALKCFTAASMGVLLLSATAFSQGAAPAVSCESLAKLVLPDTTITVAKAYAAGEFQAPRQNFGPPNEAGGPGTPAGSGGSGAQASRAGSGAQAGPGGPGEAGGASANTVAFCRVAATLKPSSDSNIRIEVWMPLEKWNGKFMGVGGGGFAGRIGYEGLVSGVKRGYATATTDSGHDSSKPEEEEGRFAYGHPEKLIDYGYRAVHLMSAEGKQITKTFYGVAPKHAYFFGSSRGGYESITEAMRYPEDYDGIGAGWPPNPFVLFNAEQLWAAWLINKDRSRFIPQSKYTMIHEEVLKECDELDGVKDGQLENPLNCHFDPKVLLCKGADAPDCLTAPQVELLTKTYQGPVNPRTGKVIFPGPAVGDELGEMYRFATGEPRSVALDMYKYVVFQDPHWDWLTLNWDSDIDKAVKATAPMLTATADLKGYVAHGGKLMIFIGWVNYHNPLTLIDYYNDVVKNVGASKAANSVRLFTIPGEVRDTLFDKVKVIEDWVEQGKTPDEITGSYYTGGKLLRTRPLCAYPKVAKYKGTGSTDEAANFACAEDKR